MTNKEFRFGLDDNFIDMFYDAHFNLEKKVPNIGKISIRYASETVVVCENIQGTLLLCKIVMVYSVYFATLPVSKTILRLHKLRFMHVNIFEAIFTLL